MPLPTPLTDEQHPQRPATAARHAVARMRTARPAHSDRRRRETSRMRTRTCDVLRTRHRTAVKQRRCAQRSLAPGGRAQGWNDACALPPRRARRSAGAFLSRRATLRMPTSANCLGSRVRAHRREESRYGCTLPSAARTRMHSYVQCMAHAHRSLLSRGSARTSCSQRGAARTSTRTAQRAETSRVRASKAIQCACAHPSLQASTPAPARSSHVPPRSCAHAQRWLLPLVPLSSSHFIREKERRKKKKNTEKTKLNTTPAHHISHSRGKWISQ